jgi:hypothetical protein
LEVRGNCAEMFPNTTLTDTEAVLLIEELDVCVWTAYVEPPVQKCLATYLALVGRHLPLKVVQPAGSQLLCPGPPFSGVICSERIAIKTLIAPQIVDSTTMYVKHAC